VAEGRWFEIKEWPRACSSRPLQANPERYGPEEHSAIMKAEAIIVNFCANATLWLLPRRVDPLVNDSFGSGSSRAESNSLLRWRNEECVTMMR
jgi:hypothetical protein